MLAPHDQKAAIVLPLLFALTVAFVALRQSVVHGKVIDTVSDESITLHITLRSGSPNKVEFQGAIQEVIALPDGEINVSCAQRRKLRLEFARYAMPCYLPIYEILPASRLHFHTRASKVFRPEEHESLQDVLSVNSIEPHPSPLQSVCSHCSINRMTFQAMIEIITTIGMFLMVILTGLVLGLLVSLTV